MGQVRGEEAVQRGMAGLLEQEDALQEVDPLA